jgi:DNA repair protein RecN (Recombination protein N)
MLKELKIKNFVLIDKLHIQFRDGLNILTGETGAGKSILIDALSGVMGERMTTDLIRTGFERSSLEGVFDISNLNQVKEVLDSLGIEFDDNILVIRRELYANGRGRCFVNATQIPVTRLKEISEYLVDIHGQNEHQNIVKVSKHREILDSFAGHQDLVNQVRDYYDRLHDLKERINSFEIDEKEKNRKIEYLSFALREIESAKLNIGEEEILKSESTILANAEKLFQEIKTAASLVKGDNGILTSLKRVEQSLAAISKYDDNISGILEAVKESLYSLEDVSIFLRDYEKNIDFSPERINEVEGRLSLIANMKKKYGDTIDEILDFAEKSKRELEAISSSDEEIEKLKREHSMVVRETKEAALALSERRKIAAKELEERVIGELRELGMAGTVFRVSIQREISPEGEIESENKKYMLYPYGLDKIEFLFSANEGEDLRQLRRVASGGEMSRIMLALKNVILSTDIVASLVFDEVDTAIGGKTAEVVGKKLKKLSKERQVLVITHLPQIASMSDNHYFVQKDRIENRSRTFVRSLNRNEKIKEIARMLAGEKITDISIKHAEEMVSLAESS